MPRAERGAIRALQRYAFGGRSVAVFEYGLDPACRYGWGSPPHLGLLEILAAGERVYAATIESLLTYEGELSSIPNGRHVAPGSLSWDNDYWGGLDAVVLYASLCARRPRTYLEIGSGFSTMFARRAIESHGLATRVVSIDPSPRTDIDGLCDEVIRRPLAEADTAMFGRLEPGDMVVLDGTHNVFMNSDTVVAFLEVLPAIPPGVLVAVDDIFLPWDYPPTWTGRWYAEQYLLATMLLAGTPGWSVRFPAWYVTNESALVERLDPLWRHVLTPVGKVAKSFWMERQP